MQVGRVNLRPENKASGQSENWKPFKCSPHFLDGCDSHGSVE